MEKIVVNFDLSRIALTAFRQNCNHGENVNEKEYNTARAGLLGTYEKLFSDLFSGRLDYFFYYSGKNVVIYSRSLKAPGKIQKSTYWIKDNEYIALSDSQYSNVLEADRNYGVKDHVVIFTGRNA